MRIRRGRGCLNDRVAGDVWVSAEDEAWTTGLIGGEAVDPGITVFAGDEQGGNFNLKVGGGQKQWQCW